MSLLPTVDPYLDDIISIQRQPDAVHHITNIERITGAIDLLEAVKQSVFCRLATEQGAHAIYPPEFGLQALDLIGKDYSYTASELMRRIKECLAQDDRVTDVKDFQPTELKGGLYIAFRVATIYGDIDSNYTLSTIGGADVIQ